MGVFRNDSTVSCCLCWMSLFIRTHQGTSGGVQADVILREHSALYPPSILDAVPSENIISGISETSVTVTCDDGLLPPGPPVNVTCNIFINSFGSITETTMVREILLLLLFLFT